MVGRGRGGAEIQVRDFADMGVRAAGKDVMVETNSLDFDTFGCKLPALCSFEEGGGPLPGASVRFHGPLVPWTSFGAGPFWAILKDFGLCTWAMGN